MHQLIPYVILGNRITMQHNRYARMIVLEGFLTMGVYGRPCGGESRWGATAKATVMDLYKDSRYWTEWLVGDIFNTRCHTLIIARQEQSGAFFWFADGGGGNEARRAETRSPQGRDARPEGPRREARRAEMRGRRAESGRGVLGEGAVSPLPTS